MQPDGESRSLRAGYRPFKLGFPPTPKSRPHFKALRVLQRGANPRGDQPGFGRPPGVVPCAG
jgi:hypothetical protein